MHRNRGILYLGVSQTAEPEMHISNVKTLVFDENGRYLSRAQEELWKLRQQCGWVCAAGRGSGVYAALALAAQLPVDRIALDGGWLAGREKLGREMNRLRAYACRNLSLVVSEVLTFGASEDELRFLTRGTQHAKLCALNGRMDVRSCLEDWNVLAENNLPI